MKSTFRTLLLPVVVVLMLTISAFQLIKTQLTITIRDEVGNIVPGATVQLYETEEDYNKEVNVVTEGKTDAKGIVKFKELKAISYFVIAKNDDKDNSGGGERTGKLEAKSRQ